MEIKYTTDLLIFAIDDKKNENCRELSKKSLSLLLVKRAKEPFKDMWCLPGGFVFVHDPPPDPAATPRRAGRNFILHTKNGALLRAPFTKTHAKRA